MTDPGDHPLLQHFTVGDWRVHPDRNAVEGPSGSRKLEPKSMKLLQLLARNAPRTTSRDEIIDELWGGKIVTEDAINKQISKLRSALGDSAGLPRYIQTVPKAGVRLIQPVTMASASADGLQHSVAKTRTILIALLIASSLVLLLLALRGDRQAWTLVQEPTTSVPGTEIEPALSPDGQWLAYVARESADETFGLYVRKVGSDEARRLTPPDYHGRSPAWSSDGRIAFVLRNRDGCFIAVGSVGAPYRPVSRCVSAEIGGLAWIGDDRLVIADHPRSGQSFRLDVLDLKSGRRDLLVEPPPGDVGDARPLVSADRRTIYFLRSKSVGPSEIYSATIGLKPVKRVTSDGAAINGLAIGPDGTILVSSQRGGHGFALWSLDPGRGEWRRLASASATGISSVPSGRLAVFSKGDRQVTLWQAPLAGGEGTAIAASTGIDWSPMPSPDGRSIAFLSNRSGDWEVWVFDRASGAVRRLTRFGGPETQDLFWSLDGRVIATSVSEGGQFDMHLIDTETGADRKVAATPADERQPTYSPDGRSLLFVRRSGAKFQLRAYDLASGRDAPLVDGVMRPVPSPDGRRVYFTRPFVDGLWVAEVRHPKPAKIAPWPDSARMRNVAVTADAVWVTAIHAGGRVALMRKALKDGRWSEIRDLADIARPSGIAILGNTVVYSRLRREEADLVTLRFEP